MLQGPTLRSADMGRRIILEETLLTWILILPFAFLSMTCLKFHRGKLCHQITSHPILQELACAERGREGESPNLYIMILLEINNKSLMILYYFKELLILN